jgi:hypothetical protein
MCSCSTPTNIQSPEKKLAVSLVPSLLCCSHDIPTAIDSPQSPSLLSRYPNSYRQPMFIRSTKPLCHRIPTFFIRYDVFLVELCGLCGDGLTVPSNSSSFEVPHAAFWSVFVTGGTDRRGILLFSSAPAILKGVAKPQRNPKYQQFTASLHACQQTQQSDATERSSWQALRSSSLCLILHE